MRKVDILGVGVNDCTWGSAMQAITGYLNSDVPGVRHIVTVNPEFVMEARRNKRFHALLNSAELATPDGIGILVAARLLGTPVRDRVTGVNLVDKLAELSAREGYTLFLLGAAEGVAEEAACELSRRYPNVKIAGTFAGSPADADFGEILQKLTEARPHILLVAYGAPRQDLWIRQHREEIPRSVRVAIGVGGVFDYLSGRVPLAPEAWRRVGLEWLYRLIKQPWRWKRILRVFAFGFLVIMEIARRKLRRNKSL